ncbi:nuclear transport factor 2 family protein [Nonomuraea sp. NPDC049421]|uniref:nuclear transport factor 2 family protein n=1 Tax=Nonomuraea sp. NPDC049421 TaxID=3155275 RepID=UPI003435921F
MPDRTPRDLFARFQHNVLSGAAALDAEMLADDVVVEQPFARHRTEGRERVAAMAEEGRASLPVTFEEFRDVTVHETSDPEVIVTEYQLVGTLRGSDVRAQAAFVVVLRARDGRIVHWREYQDRAAITEALT